MRIEVAGIPAPQGSKRHVGGGRMVEASRAVGPWREAVRAETQRAVRAAQRTTPSGGFIIDDRGIRAGLLRQPVHVDIVFWLPRPQSTPKRVTEPGKRPDIDKLARAVLDGLVDGGALLDDGQVVSLFAQKKFAETCPPGALINVWSNDE